MASNTDNRDPDRPPAGSSEDLEEALKWLEELTSRQGKSAELSNPVPPASLDSPFRGLIDSDDGDLPDWLREVTATPNNEGLSEVDAESRLDWLAKMAQRESIEELPTLEWRRLSEPMQSSILSQTPEYLNRGSDQLPAESADEDETPDTSQDDVLPLDNGSDDTIPPAESDGNAPEETVMAVEEQPAEPLVAAAMEVAHVPVDPVEDLAASLALDDEEELPSIDDLDAAMAWIEELAASQDAPIEDIPSVADRALASKLMMEAGLMPEVSPMDELGSDSDLVEGLTPTHPFIEEEDFADTVVLVETMAAEQRLGTHEAERVAQPGAAAGQPANDFGLGEITPFDEPVVDSSFEDAMAYLDEIATSQELEAQPVEVMEFQDEAVQELEVQSVEMTELQDEAAQELEAQPVEVTELQDEAAIVEAPPDEDNDLIEELALGAVALAVAVELEAHTSDSEDSGQEPVAADVVMAITPFDQDTSEVTTPEDADWNIADAAVNAADGRQHDEEQSATVPAIEDLEADDDLFIRSEQSLQYLTSDADGHEYGSLETALLALDAIALPAGKTLGDIEATLRAADLPPIRDVNTALNWLESALLTSDRPTAPTPSSELDEEELIARMPDDPDEVLAWLEQMANDEEFALVQPNAPAEASSVFPASDGPPQVQAVEWVEADLLEMPEDPDEAMAWLEGMARGDGMPEPVKTGAAQPEQAEIEPVEYEPETADVASPVIDAPAAEMSDEALPTAVEPAEPRPRRPRRKPAAPKIDDEPPAPPAIQEKEQPSAAWVDLLKPLD